MSQPSVCRIVKSVAAVIASLAPDYIKFLNLVTEGQVMQQFSATTGIPRVIGCGDSTRIPIISAG